jgi:hypothetical protein
MLRCPSASVDIHAAEEWRVVDGCPYQVSDFGRVRSTRNGKRHGRIMAAFRSHRGYFYVKLVRGGVRAKFSVHGLVARAFIGPKPDGYNINHIDCDKANNRPSNLEYVTHAENVKHARLAGRKACKLTSHSVRQIRHMSQDGVSHMALSRQFGVKVTAISRAVRKHTWAHVE